jgi:hypothetical protein
VPSRGRFALDGTIKLEEVIVVNALPRAVAKAFAAKYPASRSAAPSEYAPGKPEQFEIKGEGRKEEVTFTATGEPPR